MIENAPIIHIKEEDLSEDSLILELSDNEDNQTFIEFNPTPDTPDTPDTTDMPDTPDRPDTPDIEFIDADVVEQDQEVVKKKRKGSGKKGLTKKKGKTKSAEKEPVKVRKFPRIASKFYLHNLLLLACVRCDRTYKKNFGEKMTNCSQCAELLQFQCIQCSKRYKNYNDITMHLKYDCGKPKTFQCTLCEYKSTRKQRLVDHHKCVHVYYDPKDLIPCPKCGKSFKMAKYLRWHQSNECGVDLPLIPCPHCDFKTKYANSLRKHVLNIHKRDDSVSYACEKCGKHYKTLGALRNHVKNLCGKQPSLSCAHCEYKAYQKYPLLANHIQRNHPNVFPKDAFACRHCHTNYHHVYGLNRHMREASICAAKEKQKKERRSARKLRKEMPGVSFA